jgi:hypothetical protein
MLRNKAGIWESDDLWFFQYDYMVNGEKEPIIPGNVDLFWITRITPNDNLVNLAATSDGEVIEEPEVIGKVEQAWRMVELDNEGYFSLESYSESDSGVSKIITAISESGLEIQGNITLS